MSFTSRPLCIGFLTVLGLLSTNVSAIAETEPVLVVPDKLVQRYAAAEIIPAEYLPHFRGNGEVWVGRLVMPADERVASRTSLRGDGSFATALYPGRKLVFYAHGHDPLRVESGEEIMPSVRDAGELAFTRTAPERLRVLTGTTKLAGAATNAATAPRLTLSLLLTNKDYVYRDHGHRGGPVQVSVRKIEPTPGSPFRFDGLSPLLPYSLKVSAPGFIARTLPINPEATGTIDLETVELQPAPELTFRYVSQLDLEAPESWKTATAVEQRIICDGDVTFRYTEERDRLRNRLYLRLTPQEAGVKANFYVYPSEFRDLGPGTLEARIRDTTWLNQPSEMRYPSEQILRPGHVYFFQNQSRATNCLFEVASAPAPQPEASPTPAMAEHRDVETVPLRNAAKRLVPQIRYPVRR